MVFEIQLLTGGPLKYRTSHRGPPPKKTETAVLHNVGS